MSIRNQETGEKDTLIRNICPSSHVKRWKHRPFSRPHKKLCHCSWLYDAEHGSTDFQSCPSIICYLSLQRRGARQENAYLVLLSCCFLLVNKNQFTELQYTLHILFDITLDQKVWWKELLDMELTMSFGVVFVNIYRQYQIPLSQFMYTIFHTYHHRYTSLLQTKVRIYIIHI